MGLSFWEGEHREHIGNINNPFDTNAGGIAQILFNMLNLFV